MTPATTSSARAGRRRMATVRDRASDDARRAATERLVQRVVQIAALNSYGKQQQRRG